MILTLLVIAGAVLAIAIAYSTGAAGTTKFIMDKLRSSDNVQQLYNVSLAFVNGTSFDPSSCPSSDWSTKSAASPTVTTRCEPCSARSSSTVAPREIDAVKSAMPAASFQAA